MESHTINDLNDDELRKSVQRVTRLTVDDDFLFITFGKTQKNNSPNQYYIHSPSEYELFKVIVQQPLISKMWILELNQKNPDGVANLSEIETIERCRSLYVPDELATVFNVKGENRYIQYEGPLKDECLHLVYTLAKFS